MRSRAKTNILNVNDLFTNEFRIELEFEYSVYSF